jgi:long-chain acyl-CoA synthetase
LTDAAKDKDRDLLEAGTILALVTIAIKRRDRMVIQAGRAKTATTWAGHLQSVFERNASQPLVVDARDGAWWTYGRIMAASRAMASFLEEQGVRPGDAVTFSMENCLELMILYFAAMHAGARIIPVNPAYHPRDYDKILERVSARYFFTAPAVRARLDKVLGSRPDVKVYCLKPAVEPASAEQMRLVNFDLQQEMGQRGPSRRTLAAAGDDDVFLTMFTSGTTGLPKGINIRYGGLLANGMAFCNRLGLGPASRFYNVLAMTYLGGLYNLMLIPILAEGTLVLDRVFGPTNVFGFWDLVREHQVNTLWFSPTMLSMLLMLEPDDDLSFLKDQIRVGICGMAPLAPELKKRFEARYGFSLHENFGLSETTFVTTSYPGLPAKPGSVGLPVDGVKVAVLGPDLKPLAAGREGQVGVQTPYLMAGYEQEESAQQVAARNGGYFLTGDLGHLDSDGELFITGRQKDLIIRGGVNISPKVIEDVMYGMDAVQEAAVVGVPHPLYGEEVALAVQLREGWRDKVTVDDVRHYCDANIAHFQRPKFFFFIDQIPKGATGKIQKAVLKQLLMDKLDPLNG